MAPRKERIWSRSSNQLAVAGDRAACQTYDGAVPDLQRLEDVQAELCGALAHEEAETAVRGGIADLKGAVQGSSRRRKVWENTGQANVVGLLWHRVERKCVLDDFLCTP